MITFAMHGYEGMDPALEFGPLQAEFERRGVRSMIIRSKRTRSKTPNLDRAKVMIEALREIEGDVGLIGISNQGLFLPLVAAARPIKRLVFINAAIPQPGKSFWETARKERVFASIPAWLLAWVAPEMHEVYRLDSLPKVEYVYLSAQHDEAIRPEWERRAAREYLHVEPVVIAGAGHSDIVAQYVSEVADAALLQPQKQPLEARVRSSRPRGRYIGQGIAINHFVPLIVYFAVRPHVVSDTEALAVAWLIPLVWTLGSFAWFRRLDAFGLLGIFFYGVALFVSIFFGAGALPLKLQHVGVGLFVGLACLVSVAFRRPALVVLARGITRARGNAPLAAALADPRSKIGRTMRFLTLAIGIALLVNAALQTALALTLSTGGFLVASVVVHVATIVGIMSGALLYLRSQVD